MTVPRIPIFDVDGTLLDSDAALAAPFVALGVPAERVTFGHVLADECDRLGIALDDYLDHYDESASQPFDGVADLLSRLARWGICSNKHPRAGHAELARLGWRPEVAMFADSFVGTKELAPVLDAMGLDPAQVLFVGDTAHDRECAKRVGCRFVLAAWNPRAAAVTGDLVAAHPAEVLRLLD